MAYVGSLPLELIDTSIDFLHADTQSLCACSLVCHGWLPATRFHLFGFVEVYQSLRAAVSRRHCRHPANTLAFIELLESRNNTISPYIRGVTLDVAGENIPDTLISALYSARVRITKLVATVYRQNLAFLLRFSHMFPQITTLEVRVSQVLYHATDDYTRIYGGLLFAMAFPALQTLCFDAAFEANTGVPPSALVNPSLLHHIIFRHLRSLTLRVQDSEMVIRWLRSSGWRPRLRKLCVHIYHPNDDYCGSRSHLDALVEDVCDTLEDFTIVLDNGDVLPKIAN
ncbi:hypothetical protein BDZ94DRAFT_1249060 [Collybia nuda]|uniref:F-box domain-containing protein n=1 Tax=Collybia nuda TaxID=64659 RepID=A0A9P5YC83_9AGAR|nr:hypothetical protein BDZ94DRAFT_1249060 [Collybia nuda]